MKRCEVDNDAMVIRSEALTSEASLYFLKPTFRWCELLHCRSSVVARRPSNLVSEFVQLDERGAGGIPELPRQDPTDRRLADVCTFADRGL